MDLTQLLPTYYNGYSQQNYTYRFTVFTPVYNRADTIDRVFNSLKNQTYKNFELLIINDGSTDNSHDIITSRLKNLPFQVTYVNNKKNKHKMACLVQGFKLAKGEFFLPFDSDDECTPNALEVFNNAYNSIPNNLKQQISGVTCLCQDQYGNIVGSPFKTSPLYSSTFNNALLNKYQLEKWGFTKSSILKSITVNPKTFSKGYIPEGTLWNLISKQGFKTMYINETLRTYYLDTGNRISNQNHEKDAFGMMLYSLGVLNWFTNDYFKTNPRVFFKRIYTLLRASLFLEYKKNDYIKSLKNNIWKTAVFILWPFRKLLLKILN